MIFRRIEKRKCPLNGSKRTKSARLDSGANYQMEALEPKCLLAATFSDNFNRSDSTVIDNGWSENAGNTANLGISNNQVSPSAAGGLGGIYRPFPVTGSVTVTATLKEENGFGGLLARFDISLALNNDGVVGHGYGLHFTRGDQSYSDSRITLFDGASEIEHVLSGLQFGPAIQVSFTVGTDGGVSGLVTDGNLTYNYSFGPHRIQSTGGNFSYWTGFADSRSTSITNPRLDDLTLTAISTAPAVAIDIPDNTVLKINTVAQMPSIQANALLTGIASNAQVTYKWQVQFLLAKSKCPNADQNFDFIALGVLDPTTISTGSSYIPKFLFDAGGDLTLSVTTTIDGAAGPSAQTHIKIAGTNPTQQQVIDYLKMKPVPWNYPKNSGYDYVDILQKIAIQESGGTLNQFLDDNSAAPGMPLFNTGGDGGVGTMQLTGKIRNTSRDLWNWHLNVDDGIAKFNGSLSIGQYDNYPTRVRLRSQLFRTLSTQLLKQHPGAQIVVPKSTDSQILLIAIRAYNGAAGDDGFQYDRSTPVLEEFVLRQNDDGSLFATFDGTTNTLTTEWVQVDWRKRTFGDINYVNHVLSRSW